MIGRRASNIFRAAVVAFAVSVPSLIVLSALDGWGFLEPRAASIAGAVILIATGIIIGRPVSDLAIIRDAVDTLGTDKGSEAVSRQIARRLAPMARDLSLAIVRLGRLWRERVRTAEEQVAAAEGAMLESG